jgi:YVTN family beta-propeller protein
VAYVTNLADNTVSVIDVLTNTVTATVPVGSMPRYLAVTPDGTRVYVANNGDNNISVIDTVTNTVTDTIIAGLAPFGIAILSDGLNAYVTNNDGNDVSQVDTTANNVVTTFPVGTSPQGIAITPTILPPPPPPITPPPPPLLVLPPSDLKGGKVIGYVHGHKHVSIILHWEKSRNRHIKAYNVYRNNRLIAVVSADKPLQYADNHINKKRSYTYGVTAVSVGGEESFPITIFIE